MLYCRYTFENQTLTAGLVGKLTAEQCNKCTQVIRIAKLTSRCAPESILICAGYLAATVAMFTTRPQPRSAIAGTTACINCTRPNKVIFTSH